MVITGQGNAILKVGTVRCVRPIVAHGTRSTGLVVNGDIA